jgi:hypothetical protein
MSKQTATEWLFKKLFDEPKDKLTWYAILEQAKEMDKQQTIQFFKDYDSYILKGGYMSLQQYYKKTFNK